MKAIHGQQHLNQSLLLSAGGENKRQKAEVPSCLSNGIKYKTERPVQGSQADSPALVTLNHIPSKCGNIKML